MTRGRALRLAIFAVALCLAVLWVATTGEDDDALARSFLRNLLRHLF